MTTEPAAGDGSWEHIRARYEKGEEPVHQIARDVGLTRNTLALKAKALGWLMRNRSQAKSETTRATLKRLKDLLQQRVANLEREISDIGREVDEITNERGIRSMNTLVRTLDKVLELERKDGTSRRKTVRNYKRFNDEERGALADKLERLHREHVAVVAGTEPADQGGRGTEPAMALLGASRPANPDR